MKRDAYWEVGRRGSVRMSEDEDEPGCRRKTSPREDSKGMNLKIILRAIEKILKLSFIFEVWLYVVGSLELESQSSPE